MPDSADLQTVDEFTGGWNPDLTEHANKAIRALNALVTKAQPNGGGGSSDSASTIQIVANVFEDDGSVKLRKVSASGSLGDEITDPGSLA